MFNFIWPEWCKVIGDVNQDVDDGIISNKFMTGPGLARTYYDMPLNTFGVTLLESSGQTELNFRNNQFVHYLAQLHPVWFTPGRSEFISNFPIGIGDGVRKTFVVPLNATAGLDKNFSVLIGDFPVTFTATSSAHIYNGDIGINLMQASSWNTSGANFCGKSYLPFYSEYPLKIDLDGTIIAAEATIRKVLYNATDFNNLGFIHAAIDFIALYGDSASGSIELWIGFRDSGGVQISYISASQSESGMLELTGVVPSHTDSIDVKIIARTDAKNSWLFNFFSVAPMDVKGEYFMNDARPLIIKLDAVPADGVVVSIDRHLTGEGQLLEPLMRKCVANNIKHTTSPAGHRAFNIEMIEVQ